MCSLTHDLCNDFAECSTCQRIRGEFTFSDSCTKCFVKIAYRNIVQDELSHTLSDAIKG